MIYQNIKNKQPLHRTIC